MSSGVYTRSVAMPDAVLQALVEEIVGQRQMRGDLLRLRGEKSRQSVWVAIDCCVVWDNVVQKMAKIAQGDKER